MIEGRQVRGLGCTVGPDVMVMCYERETLCISILIVQSETVKL
jgi:hypothetical protein